jgi:hypothetical protein
MHLDESTDDDITWNIMANGQYSAVPPYNMKFFEGISSYINKMV